MKINEDLKRRILQLRFRQTEEEDKEFITLIKKFKNDCNRDAATILMKTFTSEEDFGVQEIVVSVLESADKAIYYQALLEELPRLISEAPDWAESLLEIGINFYPEKLAEVFYHVDDRNQQVFLNYICSDCFLKEYPRSRELINLLKKTDPPCQTLPLTG